MDSIKLWIIGYVISTILVLIYKVEKEKVDLQWICIYLGLSILLLVAFIGINI